MDAVLGQLLTCQYCRGPLSPPYRSGTEPWVMRCHCSRFPVIAGIPILKGDQPSERLVRLIEQGRHFDAFVMAMMPPAHSAPSRGSYTSGPPIVRRLVERWVVRRQRREERRWQERARSVLGTVPDAITAVDMMDFFYRQPPTGRPEGYDHFSFHFGDPRHLVALSFATLIEQPVRPVLEIACGFGHITRGLVARVGGQPVIGIDRSFFALYVAKTRIAPDAHFVCMDTELGLPFADGSFDAAFCVDGWQYFRGKLLTLRELRRVVRRAGPVMMLGSRNRHHNARDGWPLSPEEYVSIVADLPHRILADDAVLDRYIEKRGPPLAVSSSMDRLHASAMLSIVVCEDEALWKDYGEFREWPHAHGALALNLLYRVDREADADRVRLRRVFPSAGYEEQMSDYKRYLPEELSVEREVFSDLERGARTPEVERLIERCVVVGFPAHYR